MILSRYRKYEIFRAFLEDIIPNTNLISLPPMEYGSLIDVQREYGLDFDDAYQVSTARYYDARLVTMDNDFQKLKDARISFL